MSKSKDLSAIGDQELVKPTERPAEEPAKSVARREDGTLQPGSNLNPGGRNQWTERNQVRAALDTLAVDVPPESMKDRRIIWRCFIGLVKRGDPWAVKEYFSRRWPAPRAGSSELAGLNTVILRDYTGQHPDPRLGPGETVAPERRLEPGPVEADLAPTIETSPIEPEPDGDPWEIIEVVL